MAIERLKELRRDALRHTEMAESKRRKMRPSERAMTIAHYMMTIEALNYAIKRLEEL
jgi:hypothetical protein